ncbi:hypothetical protein ACOSQ4_017262 [Xanthoceras sorbifolium]
MLPQYLFPRRDRRRSEVIGHPIPQSGKWNDAFKPQEYLKNIVYYFLWPAPDLSYEPLSESSKILATLSD